MSLITEMHADGTILRQWENGEQDLFSTEEQDQPPAEITLADVAAALRDPLANLTPSSESTTVRTAILNQRAALDALLGQLETP